MISVIIGVYNGEKTILRAISSILNGEYGDIEIIVCDDASQDGTAAAVKGLNEDRVRLIINETNQGLGYSLQRCLDLSRGEFIARMDADDFSLPDRLSKQIEFLDAHPECAFCGGAAYLTWENKRWGKISYPERPDRNLLLSRNPFIHPTVVFRREALVAVGGYSAEEKYFRCEDYELYFRLYEKELYGANIPDVLIEYTESPAETSKHTFASRRNESRVRREGAKRLKAGLSGFIKSYYPIIVHFLPRKFYLKRRNAHWMQK